MRGWIRGALDEGWGTVEATCMICCFSSALLDCRLVALAAMLATGVTLGILACALWDNWWPLFVGTTPCRICCACAS